MSVLHINIACCIVFILHLSVSDAEQAYACGPKENPCKLLYFECLPGGTINITKAYAVRKDKNLNCQKNVTNCPETYVSNCCSEVKEGDSIMHFDKSKFHTVKEHCDNKQTCSDLILTHTTGLLVVEYNCKTDSTATAEDITTPFPITDYQTSTQKASRTKAVSIALCVLCVCAFLLGGSATLVCFVKRYRARTSLHDKQREITYDYISGAPFVNTIDAFEYSHTPVDHSKDGNSVYNHLNEFEPRVEGHYDTTASTMAYLRDKRTKESDDLSQDEGEIYNHVGDIQERIVVVDNTYSVVQVLMKESQC